MGRVRIKWCGHSYLVVEPEDGPVIALDPHDGGSIGLPECRVKADYTLVTHTHYDHNAVEMSGGKVIVKKLGSFRLGEVRVEGYKFYHDRASGRLRGDTAAYIMDLGGLRIAHLGDIGHVPPPGALKPFSGVDVLALPVGGVYTIDAIEAKAIVEITSPKLVIPLHFWVPGSLLPLDPLNRFLDISKTRRLRLEDGVLEVEPPLPQGRATIVVFERTATGARALL